MKFIFFISMLFSLIQPAVAQKLHPVPPKNAASLFYIQHSDNHNTFVYEAVLKGKLLHEEEPVSVYRKMYAKKGKTEPLTAIQRTMAYGVDCKKFKGQFF